MNIPLEKQVTNKEISQRLKELGVKQESLFWWVRHFKDNLSGEGEKLEPEVIFEYEEKSISQCDHDEYGGRHEVICSAFTVAELGEMLPPRLQTDKYNDNTWGIYWLPANANEFNRTNHRVKADTEADARSKMLVYLLENELITLQ